MEQSTKPLQKEKSLENTVQQSTASLNRRSFLWRGLAIGGVTIGTGLVAGTVPVSAKTLDHKTAFLAGQDNWRWCNRCQGLFFAGNFTTGFCPLGGGHNYSGSGDYTLNNFVGGSLQDNWRWCHKCQGLYFAGNGTAGFCPAGGGHENIGSGDYSLNFGAIASGQQDNWRWCHKCQGLYFAGNRTVGACPAGGGHENVGSGDYSLSQ